jgi:hypothetical protein
MEPQPPWVALEHETNRSRPERTFRRRRSLDAGTAVVYAALVAVLLERMSAVAADLQLWADGAWFLIRVASTRSYYFWVGDWKREFFRARIFTILWEQTPLVLATHLRVHSLHALSLIFGFSLYSHALLSLYICYRYASRRWYMLFPLLSFFAGTMNVEAYLATDSHFIVSLYWPVLFILLFGEELTGWTLVLLLGLSVPMVVSYESMMFFGVILAGFVPGDGRDSRSKRLFWPASLSGTCWARRWLRHRSSGHSMQVTDRGSYEAWLFCCKANTWPRKCRSWCCSVARCCWRCLHAWPEFRS